MKPISYDKYYWENDPVRLHAWMLEDGEASHIPVSCTENRRQWRCAPLIETATFATWPDLVASLYRGNLGSCCRYYEVSDYAGDQTDEQSG